MFCYIFVVRVEFNYQDYSVKHKFYDTKSHDLPSDIKFYSQWNLDKLEGFLFPLIKAKTYHKSFLFVYVRCFQLPTSLGFTKFSDRQK